ncbi:ribosomal protection-like ABC-F family protein [Schleiferilactobacillus perolens]|jgi:ATPase subunit of ABC transporter with duplicated ATPase domains|uniref:ribosomal protection-like ABC-F family protein n=1 Tax=Schleiferilactobacillus perolens TaxID=100468 RepID=UPI002357A124|nr:ABC-F family ATP-binding cassette domain-containing protein [Schleiferilactobacillus perolens]MCI2171101.1 ATP-binding cassette domain-containing protein [Schleiferilactobacillus perolens]
MLFIQASKITKQFDHEPLFVDISLQLAAGDRVALVGANGTGKSTLMDILLGSDTPSDGVVSRAKDATIAHLNQQLIDTPATVTAFLGASQPALTRLQDALRYCENQMSQPDADLDKVLARYANLQQDFEDQGGYAFADRINTVMKGLAIWAYRDTPVNQLSGGERMRVALAQLLLSDADFFLLDEPTNHLDTTGIEWLEQFLLKGKTGYLVISHDRMFLDRVTTQTWEIEDGELVTYPGNYSRYIKLKAERLASIQKDHDLQAKAIRKLQLQIRQYRQWANESQNEKFFRKAKELEKRLAKIQVIQVPQPPKHRLQNVRTAGRSGNDVITARDLGESFGPRILFQHADFQIHRGDRVAVTGANGTGKSTLVKLILGQLTPTSGTVTLGASLQPGYLPQNPQFDSPQERLLAYVQTFMPNEQAARQAMARFGFFADDAARRLQDLSGGERIRLTLLQLFQKKINLLILDEPTNHLDIAAREEIESLLQEYAGTLLIVSHDRYLLCKLCDQELHIAGERITQKVWADGANNA